jgi:hypothetical protein
MSTESCTLCGRVASTFCKRGITIDSITPGAEMVCFIVRLSESLHAHRPKLTLRDIEASNQIVGLVVAELLANLEAQEGAEGRSVRRSGARWDRQLAGPSRWP